MVENRKTNVEAVVDLMEFSRYGAVAQLFVVDALGKQAKRVADAAPEAFAGMNNGFINQAAWQGVAREIVQKLDAHLGCSSSLAEKAPANSAAPVVPVAGPDEDEIAGWLSRQIEDGAIKLEDIPRLMAKYALAAPGEMRDEFAERMEMQREESVSARM